MNRFIISIIVILAAASNGPVVTKITAENAEKVLPNALVLQHCALAGYNGLCDTKDFFGVAVDLNGNGSPEFSISNKKINSAGASCNLYRDEKAGFELIQKNFPCSIEPAKGHAKGWLDITGIIYPTGCEPLRCEFTWTGFTYKQGSCVPVKEGTCNIE